MEDVNDRLTQHWPCCLCVNHLVIYVVRLPVVYQP
eukprot:UN16349